MKNLEVYSCRVKYNETSRQVIFTMLTRNILVLLCACVQGELGAAGCSVVVMTFGGKNGAVRWRQETECPFPYYRDVKRGLYTFLGLKRYSIYIVWLGCDSVDPQCETNMLYTDTCMHNFLIIPLKNNTKCFPRPLFSNYHYILHSVPH